MDSLKSTYAIRNGAVYWKNQPVKGADPGSFVQLANVWGIDQKWVYVLAQRRSAIDRKTFRLLNPVYGLDHQAVYDWEGVIKSADPSTFQVLDSGIAINEEIVPEAWNRGFARDKSNVYYHDQMEGRATVVRGADAPTFRVL